MQNSIPQIARQVTDSFAPAFTPRTHSRFVLLLLGAILTLGCRTVSNILRLLGRLAPGHPTSYHRVLSQRRVRSWKLARLLAGLVLRVFYPDPNQPVRCCGDDTVVGRGGKNVYGKGCHRDAVRSSHSFTAYRWGHKWVVLAILVSIPGTRRPWALPVLVALYRPQEENQKLRRRHKTPAQLMEQMLRVLMGWFPQRKFVFCGDGGFATHSLARLAHRHRSQLVLVSRFYPGANLYAPPPSRGKRRGRPPKKGNKLPSPREVVQQAKRRRKLSVAWYGGTTRRVEVVTGTGHWYKSGRELVPVRWVWVRDLTGTRREEYFFTTDVGQSPRAVLETFTTRWSLEVTFQEVRSHLGLETTRGWCKNTVLRSAPWLFGLYTVVVLLYHRLPRRWRKQRGVQWRGKETVTFSDSLSVVRRWLWVHWVFETACPGVGVSKLPPRLRRTVLFALSLAT